jgi:hypothetical protein
MPSFEASNAVQAAEPAVDPAPVAAPPLEVVVVQPQASSASPAISP